MHLKPKCFRISGAPRCLSRVDFQNNDRTIALNYPTSILSVIEVAFLFGDANAFSL